MALSYTVLMSHKVSDIAVSPCGRYLACSTSRNDISVFRVHKKTSEERVSIQLPGHRSDVRAVALSSDDTLLASCGHGKTKIWKVSSCKCTTSLKTGYGLCVAFLPGDGVVAVGTKKGEILLLDVASASLINTVEAHSGPVWDMCLNPDGKGLASVSGDGKLCVWKYVVDKKTKSLTLVLEKSKEMDDEALSVKYSPDGKLIAVALLNATIQVMYADTLKFFLVIVRAQAPGTDAGYIRRQQVPFVSFLFSLSCPHLPLSGFSSAGAPTKT